MKLAIKPIIVATVTSLIVGSSIFASERVAQASPASSAPVTDASTKTQDAAQTKTFRYGDADVLNFVLFGQGPIAAKYPRVASRFRAGQQTTKLNSEQLGSLLKQLTKVDPQYSKRVTQNLQKNDPYAAERGIKFLNADLQKLEASSGNTALPDASKSRSTVKSHVVVYINVFITAQLYANAAVATEAIVVLVVVPAAVSYQFDTDSVGQVQYQNYVADVTVALAS